MTDAPRGLVLAGGASRRMQADKALLEYHGRPHLQWTFELVSAHCEPVYISVRPGQHDPVRDVLPRIEDSAGVSGPAAGLLAAARFDADRAWLAVACDLPFLDDAVLARLLRCRDREVMATAYRSAHDGLPEPLCAIWEPRGLDFLREQVSHGTLCPRKALIRGQVKLIEPVVHHALDNVNTPAERAAARAGLDDR